MNLENREIHDNKVDHHGLQTRLPTESGLVNDIKDANIEENR